MRLSQPASREGARYRDPFVGHWCGEGRGLWVADASFRYREEVTLTSTGKPLFHYLQRTNCAVDNRPLHTATGYLRATGESTVELLIVQLTGFAEIYAGSTSPTELSLTLISVARTPTALSVAGLQRYFFLEGDTLT